MVMRNDRRHADEVVRRSPSNGPTATVPPVAGPHTANALPRPASWTHWASVEVICRARIIWATETFTMVASTMVIETPRLIASRPSRRPCPIAASSMYALPFPYSYS